MPKTKVKKSPKAKTTRHKSSASSHSRQIKAPQYKSFRLQKRIKHQRLSLPSAWSMFKDSVRHLWMQKKLFGLMMLVHALLVFVLVRNLSVTTSLGEAKTALEALLSGASGKLVTGTALFGSLLGTGAPDNTMSVMYQSTILVIMSLAIIWALRQTYAKAQATAKETFYKGMTPLVTFLLVLGVIGLQLIPVLVANMIFGFVFGNGLASTVLEQVLWGVLVCLLVTLSLYMITSSIFALLIVTLPDVTPLQALRSARGLVLHRRWVVMRKLLFLPLFLMLVGAGVFVPIILFVTPVAEWLYFVFTILVFFIAQSYFYSVYRELIK